MSIKINSLEELDTVIECGRTLYEMKHGFDVNQASSDLIELNLEKTFESLILNHHQSPHKVSFLVLEKFAKDISTLTYTENWKEIEKIESPFTTNHGWVDLKLDEFTSSRVPLNKKFENKSLINAIEKAAYDIKEWECICENKQDCKILTYFSYQYRDAINHLNYDNSQNKQDTIKTLDEISNKCYAINHLEYDGPESLKKEQIILAHNTYKEIFGETPYEHTLADDLLKAKDAKVQEAQHNSNRGR